jgi:hypothetical protein
MNDVTTRYVTVLGTLAEMGPRQYAVVEYPYECACGEEYREVEYAATCRKCRTYAPAGRCTHVTDTRTGEVVWGTEPTEEEVAEHEEVMLAQREEWLDELARMQGEGERYERLEAERRAAEAQAERELIEDIMYLAQDELSGLRPRC